MPTPQTLLFAAALAIVPSLVYLWILNAIDKYEKEPWTILLACVGLGAVAAPIISIGVLVLSGRGPELSPQLAPGPGGADPFPGIVQELVKGLLLIALTRLVRDEFDDILDGIIYGAAIGAGFGATETFLYAIGGTGGLSTGTLVALLVSGLDHAFYTAVVGAALGYAARLEDGRLALVVALYGLATAALLHALHDALPAILARATAQPGAVAGVATRLLAQLINVLGLITLAVAVWAAQRREARVLHEQLREEVDAGVLSSADYAAIGSYRARLARQASLRRHGMDKVAAQRRLYATAGELAFHKWRLSVRRRHRPPASRTEELRAEVVRLRRQLEERAA